MNYRKKLIEVALPLEDINREAAREKSSGMGIRPIWANFQFADLIRESHPTKAATALNRIDWYNRTLVWFNQTP